MEFLSNGLALEGMSINGTFLIGYHVVYSISWFFKAKSIDI